MFEERGYRPLPPCLTIRESDIHGLGIFAVTEILAGTILGESHFTIGDEIKRTPLGGFINHSEDSNCVRKGGPLDYFIQAKRSISRDEELTLTYEWYKP